MAIKKRVVKDASVRKVEAFIRKALSEDRVTVRYYGGRGEVLVDGEVYAKFGTAAAARRWLKEMSM